MYTVLLKGVAVTVLITLLQSCNGQEGTYGTCSNSVVVLTKEELKNEIRVEMAEIITKYSEQSAGGNCTCNCNKTPVPETGDLYNITEISTIVEEKLEKLLLPIMNKLMTLHQPGLTASHPATSCSEIFDFNPHTPSGHYWLEASNGSAIHVYCDMILSCKGVGGGWMQVAKLNMTNSSHQCPPGTRLKTYPSKRLCGRGIDSAGCSSTVFDAHSINFNHVCGKIIAYQDKTPDAFRGQQLSVDQNYVDGISLTHGRNPRKHIWTFAAALHEVGSFSSYNCPCTNIRQTSPQPPSFIGSDYFCDTGSTHRYQYILYGDDPLWDGAGCGPLNTCCSLNNPPWFYKRVSTTTSDNIEMRICSDQPVSNEDTPIEIVELYVK